MLVTQEWFDKHKDDYTQEEIDALGIEISMNGHAVPKINQGEGKRVSKVINILKEV